MRTSVWVLWTLFRSSPARVFDVLLIQRVVLFSRMLLSLRCQRNYRKLLASARLRARRFRLTFQMAEVCLCKKILLTSAMAFSLSCQSKKCLTNSSLKKEHLFFCLAEGTLV